MTFEEIQAAIEGMLSVQRNLQESQIQQAQEIVDLKESIGELRGSITELRRTAEDQKDSIERLLRLSITHIEGHIDNRVAIENLSRRIESLEDRS